MKEGIFYAVGKAVIIVLTVLFVLALGIILTVISDYPFWGILLSVLIALSYVLIISFLLKIKISLNSEGIEYNSRKLTTKMAWDEIGKVDIFRYPRAYFRFIGFCKSVDGKIIDNYLSNSENYIYVGYNRRIIKIIEEYWDKEIERPNG